MVYLPTFIIKNQLNVGEYTIHGSYGTWFDVFGIEGLPQMVGKSSTQIDGFWNNSPVDEYYTKYWTVSFPAVLKSRFFFVFFAVVFWSIKRAKSRQSFGHWAWNMKLFSLHTKNLRGLFNLSLLRYTIPARKTIREYKVDPKTSYKAGYKPYKVGFCSPQLPIYREKVPFIGVISPHL